MASHGADVQYPNMRKGFENLGATYIKEWRRAAGMTLEALGAEIGMTHASLSRIEARKQPYSQGILEAIADVFGCKPEDLLSGPPPDPTSLGRAKRLREAMRLFQALSKDRQDRVIADLIDAAHVEGKLSPALALPDPTDPKLAKTD